MSGLHIWSKGTPNLTLRWVKEGIKQHVVIEKYRYSNLLLHSAGVGGWCLGTSSNSAPQVGCSALHLDCPAAHSLKNCGEGTLKVNPGIPKLKSATTVASREIEKREKPLNSTFETHSHELNNGLLRPQRGGFYRVLSCLTGANRKTQQSTALIFTQEPLVFNVSQNNL